MFNSPEECCAEVIDYWASGSLEPDLYVVIERYLGERHLGDGWGWSQTMPERNWHVRHFLGFNGMPPTEWCRPAFSVYVEPPRLWPDGWTSAQLAMRLRPQG
jgi:hypothetical protein